MVGRGNLLKKDEIQIGASVFDPPENPLFRAMALTPSHSFGLQLVSGRAAFALRTSKAQPLARPLFFGTARKVVFLFMMV